jgi:hypothetical protein
MVPIVYSPEYNVSAFGLERLHPFDGQKYRRIHDWLIAQGLRTQSVRVQTRGGAGSWVNRGPERQPAGGYIRAGSVSDRCSRALRSPTLPALSPVADAPGSD